MQNLQQSYSFWQKNCDFAKVDTLSPKLNMQTQS